jgi:hypothetical protein
VRLAEELIAMRDEDVRVRQQLADAGELEGGYQARMEAVHRRNAARLKQMIAEHGWPGRSVAGEDGSEAAWLILQHSIGEPDFQRAGLALVQQAVAAGEAPAWQAAYLIDRIRVFEGKTQVYGTQSAWNDDGAMAPCPMEEPDIVDERRASVGLKSIADSKRGPDPAPVLPEQVQRERAEMDAWARRTGWRS